MNRNAIRGLIYVACGAYVFYLGAKNFMSMRDGTAEVGTVFIVLNVLMVLIAAAIAIMGAKTTIRAILHPESFKDPDEEGTEETEPEPVEEIVEPDKSIAGRLKALSMDEDEDGAEAPKSAASPSESGIAFEEKADTEEPEYTESEQELMDKLLRGK